MSVLENIRKTVYNNITSEEKLAKVNPENIQLGNDFLEYLTSIDRAKTTVNSYEADLKVFWCWNEEFNNNKFFVNLSKREIAKFQNYALNTWGWSPARMRRVKSTLSSLSNFVESMLDDEYEDYRPIVRKIENPAACAVREKTVLEEEQLQKLLDYLVEKKRYDKACMLALAMCSGRRKAELVRFKVSYFDDANIIYGSLYKTPEAVKTKGRGNGKFIHCYTLRHKFKPYLDMWLAERKKRGIESEWLFPRKDDLNEHLKPETLNSWANTFTKFLGVDFYWHCLRHYFTTHLVRMGLPDGVIQDIIGWSSADMLRLYTDIPVDEQIGKYFDENGIKTVDKASISDL